MLAGGCLCGACRFEIDAPLTDCGFCHCRICQRAAGAPMALFGSTKVADFRWTAGKPVLRRSTDFGQRWFCPTCGTQLAMQVDYARDTLDVSIMALDNPGAATPEFHIWCESAQPWSYPLDDLPHYAQRRPPEARQSADS